VTEIKLYEKVC